MNIVCIAMLACVFALSVMVCYGHWSDKRDKKRACPLFRRSSYCSGQNSILKDDYLNRLQLLHDYDSTRMAYAIRRHPDTLHNLVEGWAEGDTTMPENDALDIGMLNRYLTVLEVCSQFHLHGFITSSMFWGNYDYQLRDILLCKALCAYIAHKPALCGLKAELAEAKRRIQREEVEVLLPD